MSSALRVLEVCEALSELQPIGVRELARRIDQPRSSVQRALETLLAGGWAARSDDAEWVLTSRCFLIGARAGAAGALQALARPAMVRLLALTDESVRLWVLEGDHMALVQSLDGTQPVRYVSPPPGAVLPLHASASGKAVLARLPQREVDDYLDRPLPATTELTITDPAVLRDELEATRIRGWSQTFQEARSDVGGVAAAVFDSAGKPVAALSLALPMHRVTDALVALYGAAVAKEAAWLSDEFTGTEH
jgi:IclR family transcriptional regulator, acetate operon repressor